MTADSSDQMDEPPALPDASKETRVDDVASLVAGINRFLSYFAQNPAFKDAKIGLAEWLVLTMLALKTAENSKSLIRMLGLTPQRLKQILEPLKSAGLVEISGSPSPETIAISEQGQRTIDMISGALQPQITEAFKGRERVVPAVDRGLKLLYRAVAPTRSQ